MTEIRPPEHFELARVSAAVAAFGLLISCWLPLPVDAADSVAYRQPMQDASRTDRIIVKWRTAGVAAVQIEAVQDRATRLSQSNGIPLRPVRNLFGSTDVMQLDHTPTRDEMQTILARLNADPGVEYAEPDGYRFIQAFPQDPPNDPHFIAGSDGNGSWQGQWYLQPSSSTTPSALGAISAWANSNALGTNVVVAVIDTGVITAQPDLAGQLLPGYDFVSCDQGNLTANSGGQTTADCSATGSAASYLFANNGHGWQAGADDPGDWIATADTTNTLFINAGCTSVEPSSWHGTKVAGVIAAATNNGIGIAGVAPNARILPVRAIGKCSGRVSDIAAAIMWAAGQPVTVDAGSITASTPAKIINLSLGNNTSCSTTEQNAITAATNAGILVVAAAGNEGGAIDAPANCTGVVSVVGLRETGTKVPFSNLSSSSSAATIAAPGGNCVNSQAGQPCLYDIETTTDAGSTTPAPTPGFYTYSQLSPAFLNSGGNSANAANVGTSFAAPMVAGTAALMLSANTSLTSAQVIARLQSSALAFPTSSSTSNTQCQLASATADSNGNFSEPGTPAECVCTTATCGAGMVNAAAAVLQAIGMFVQITPSRTSASPGDKVRLDGSGSTAAAGFTIASYQWTTDPSTSDQLIDPNQAIATLVIPSFRSITAILTITDNVGRTASGSVTIKSALAETTGAGSLMPMWIALLAAMVAWQLHRRRARCAAPR
ncbi:MAG TPA: S8 family serine peptidase [Steroidobacteraceae bacterium]